MRLSSLQFWNQHKERKPANDLSLKVIKNVNKDQQLWRDILAYWILGLCTEFGYVVIISAAHDILHRFEAPKVWMPFINNNKNVFIHFNLSMFRMRNHRKQYTIHRQIIEIFVRNSQQVYH